jgi:hypothetical protein
MTLGWLSAAASPLAHTTERAAIPAVALFLAGIAATFGVFQLRSQSSTMPRRAMSVVLGGLAAGSFILATVLPILLD